MTICPTLQGESEGWGSMKQKVNYCKNYWILKGLVDDKEQPRFYVNWLEIEEQSILDLTCR